MIAVDTLSHPDGRGGATLDHHPDECPICHRAMSISGMRFIWIDEQWLEGLYQCPNLKCHHLFIAAFERDRQSYIDDVCEFRYAVPFVPINHHLDQELRKVSLEFAETYQQSWQAKEEKLMKIAGTGFRRALEFLVKDYASRGAEPADLELIRKKPLVQCIRDHIKEEGIQTVAERAAWLGNDETHYLRKWEDKDIDDLIDLIDSVGDWIVIHLKTERLKATMQPKK